jgi:Transposase IS66 family
MPLILVEAIRANVFTAKHIHADDTTVRVLAKGKTRTGRGYGPMCATTGRSADGLRQRQHSCTGPIVAASIPNTIWRTMPG